MRHIVLLGLALLVLAGIAWLLLENAPPRASFDAEAVAQARAVARSTSLPSEPSSALVESETPRELARAVAPTVVSASAETLLRVQFVDAASERPIEHVRARLGSAGPDSTGWSTRGVDGARGSERESPVSDSDGRVELVVRPGVEYDLRAEPRRFEDPVEPITTRVPPLANGETRDLLVRTRVDPNQVLFVRALDRVTRSPAGGVNAIALGDPRSFRVDRRLARPREDPELARAVTDANGVARLDLRSWQRPYLALEGGGYGRALAPVGGAHATPQSALEVLLTRSAKLWGTLAGAAGGEVLLRAPAYELLPEDQRRSLMTSVQEVAWTARVERDGRFAFDELPARRELAAEHWTTFEGGRSLGKTVVLDPGETRTVEWALGGDCVVRGRVLDRADAPVVDVEVWIVPETSPRAHVFDAYSDAKCVWARARTDEDGAFELAGVRPGAWQVGLAAPERGSRAQRGVVGLSERVEVLPGDSVRDVVLRVDRDLFVEGRVLAPDGSEMTRAFVSVSGLEGQGSYSQSAREVGFRVGPLPRGRYRLSAIARPHAPSEEAEAEAGATGVVLRLAAGATIRGRVVDDSGASPPFELQLSASEGSSARISMMTLGTRMDGTFEAVGLLPGSYDVIATWSGSRFGVAGGVLAVAGETSDDVVVHLAPGARVRIRCAEARGTLFVRSGGALVQELQPDPTAPVECAVPAGSVRVELVRHVASDGTRKTETIARTTVDVAPGETKELVLEVAK